MEALPDNPVEAAKSALERFVRACDPAMQALLDAPEDDEAVAEEDLREIAL